jgi:hypothetical protein
MAQVSEARMPSLSSSFCGLKPGVSSDDEGGKALLAELGIGHREDDRDRGALAVGDELLRAVQHPAAVLQHGSGLEVVGLAARLGSVRQKQPILRPAAMSGSQAFFCASLPTRGSGRNRRSCARS